MSCYISESDEGIFPTIFLSHRRRLPPHIEFADTCLNEIGTRVFDVEIGGEKILEEFDVVKEVGRFTAVDKYFELTIEGRKLMVGSEEVDGLGVMEIC